MTEQSTILIEEIGGEDIVKELVECFYDLIETHERGKKIHILHMSGHGVPHSRIEQFNFLCGFMGGRNHYLEKHGHMNLKLIHEHVDINRETADDWLFCMRLAMAKVGIAPEPTAKLNLAFERVALVLINKP